ncbi:hypothetical protein HCA61_22860 [Rhodococcus sp. HNM0563]|uniref:hypothetical protein n=1 Tax=unclassified Rhodococcus (in: high G+C Gram-positive bacteria) TaxID=192944 RepID=UPI00146A3BBD|nr:MULTISPECIES: hypothetical protein [unclassified Rhodococcus (in: high G+C Gram-positive bacteria)]MCK0093095.1 hypothetical protein [Rhodococcus sp. F64268]NLU65080.1 hypothetical protein [Rhodococcus sp. HNM0563]
MPSLIDPRQRIDEKSLRLLPDVTARDVAAALAQIAWRAPTVAASAVSGLKFSAALPLGLAERTLSERLGDDKGARAALEVPRTIRRRGE